MTWKVAEVNPEELVISLEFTNKESVSTDSIDRDKVSIKLLNPDLIIGARSQRAVKINERQIK